jgi:hypothetical protein
MAVDLFDMVSDDAASYITRDNALRALYNVRKAIPDNATVFTTPRPSDGRWLAVVIFNEGMKMDFPYLIKNGICITT